MMACSAAWSTSVTKSLGDLVLTLSMSTSSDARLMMAPAARAALMAHPEALAMASGATELLAQARIVDSLADALAGVDFICATAMTPRDFGPPTQAPCELFATLAPQAHRVAFVFGSERFGMSNDD